MNKKRSFSLPPLMRPGMNECCGDKAVWAKMPREERSDRDQTHGLSAGVYFLRPEGKEAKPLRVVKVR